MSELINLRDFLEHNFEGFDTWNEFAKLPDSEIPGVVLRDGEVYLTPYNPQEEFLYHQGFFRGSNSDNEFDNLENLRRGYFGNPEGYTYLAADNEVKPSRPLMDLELKIDTKRLGRKLYRDPETFLKKYHYEWGRSLMMVGAIPKVAIVGVSFNKVGRFIQELRKEGDNIIPLDQVPKKIEHIRRDFGRELGFQQSIDLDCSTFIL